MSDGESTSTNDHDGGGPVLTATGRKSRANGLSAMPPNYIPTENDVICAKGNDAKNHPGNKFLRSLIYSHMDEYKVLESRTDRAYIVTNIIQQIRTHGGRFIRRTKGGWADVGARNSREKIGAAFRDLLHDQYSSSAKAKAIRKRKERKGLPIQPKTLDRDGRNPPRPASSSAPASSNNSTSENNTNTPNNGHSGSRISQLLHQAQTSSFSAGAASTITHVEDGKQGPLLSLATVDASALVRTEAHARINAGIRALLVANNRIAMSDTRLARVEAAAAGARTISEHASQIEARIMTENKLPLDAPPESATEQIDTTNNSSTKLNSQQNHSQVQPKSKEKALLPAHTRTEEMLHPQSSQPPLRMAYLHVPYPPPQNLPHPHSVDPHLIHTRYSLYPPLRHTAIIHPYTNPQPNMSPPLERQPVIVHVNANVRLQEQLKVDASQRNGHTTTQPQLPGLKLTQEPGEGALNEQSLAAPPADPVLLQQQLQQQQQAHGLNQQMGPLPQQLPTQASYPPYSPYAQATSHIVIGKREPPSERKRPAMEPEGDYKGHFSQSTESSEQARLEGQQESPKIKAESDDHADDVVGLDKVCSGASATQ